MSEHEREYIKDTLRQCFEMTLEERVDRYCSINHQRVMGLHHFSHASSECLDLFRDGYFTTCVMGIQAVADGIIEFVAARNGYTKMERETKQELATRMQQAGIVTENFVTAFIRIRGSFRNDVHHMNPPVGQIDFDALARQNIGALAVIEREIFGCSADKGMLIPNHPIYWDIEEDGSVACYVRFS